MSTIQQLGAERELDAENMQLAVLGHPISHSRSPQLHRAAYGVLGLPWRYESADVTEAQLPSFFASLDTRPLDTRSLDKQWRGLSLTMPLKRAVLPLLDDQDELVAMMGVANTVLFERRGNGLAVRGFNTDVDGVVETLLAAHADLGDVHVLGSGATAASVLVALSRLGVVSATVSTRSPERTDALRSLARRIGLTLTVWGLGSLSSEGQGPDRVPSLLVSTLPGGAHVDFPLPRTVPAGALLFDVAYDPWPTPLAAAWQGAGGEVVCGLELLVHQALHQVRIFVSGQSQHELDGEKAVVAGMRGSVGLS